MLKNDWGRQLLFAGLVGLLFLLIALNLEYRHNPPSDLNAKSQPDYEQAAHESRAWIDAVKKGEGKKPSEVSGSQSTEDGEPYHNALDLAAQWLAAQSAEKIVFWTIIQVVLSTLGLGGVIATVVYTHKTLRLADFTTRSELRAYISVETVDDLPPFKFKNGKFATDLRMTNRGQTPARKVCFRARFRLINRAPDDTFNYNIPDTLRSTFTLFGNQPFGMSCEDNDGAIPANEASLLATFVNGWVIALYGEVYYRTIFNEDVHTEFCLYSEFLGHSSADGTKIRWIAAPHHNDAT